MTTAPIPLRPVETTPEIPHSYVIVCRTQQCACGSFHNYAELYSRSQIPSRFGFSNKVTHLTPILAPQYDLPIAIIHSELKRIPFCHECAGLATLSNLPPPPTHIPEPRPKVGAPTPQRTAQPAKRVPTLDDVLAGLTSFTPHSKE